jgi:coenzyme F420-reducing hydrogenase alpha subunit
VWYTEGHMSKEKEISKSERIKKAGLIISQMNDFSIIDEKVKSIAEKFKKTLKKKSIKTKIDKAAKSRKLH